MPARSLQSLGVTASLLALAAVTFPGGLVAQTTVPEAYARHGFYGEAGGLPAFEGGAWSINYEHRVVPRGYIRVGLFAAPVDGETTVIVPLLYNHLLNGSRNHFEIGAGLRLDLVDVSEEVRLAGTVGYRWQQPGRSLIARAGLAFDLGPSDWTLYPWPALSLGFGL